MVRLAVLKDVDWKGNNETRKLLHFCQHKQLLAQKFDNWKFQENGKIV